MTNVRSIHNLALAVASGFLLGACSSQAPAPQVITGRVALETFPAQVVAARAVQSGRVVMEAPVAADGAFTLAIAAGTGYRIEFAQAAGQAGLVFPRQSGTITAVFGVQHGAAPFDLGAVRYVGDPRSLNYTYRSTPGASGDGDNVQCEDGIDATTGAVCVDDTQDQNGGTCAAADGDNVDCQDGIDPKTGAPCDGGPAANSTANDGSDGAETAATGDGDTVQCENGVDPTTGAACADDDSTDVGAESAVADHNLPGTLGCGGEEGSQEGGD